LQKVLRTFRADTLHPKIEAVYGPEYEVARYPVGYFVGKYEIVSGHMLLFYFKVKYRFRDF